MSDDEVIHELNSWQMLLFRVNLIVLPILLVSVIGLGTWLVQNQYKVNSRLAIMEERFTQTALVDSVRIQILEMRQRIMAEIAAKYPPKDLIEDVHENKTDIRHVLDMLRKKALNE